MLARSSPLTLMTEHGMPLAAILAVLHPVDPPALIIATDSC